MEDGAVDGAVDGNLAKEVCEYDIVFNAIVRFCMQQQCFFLLLL